MHSIATSEHLFSYSLGDAIDWKQDKSKVERPWGELTSLLLARGRDRLETRLLIVEDEFSNYSPTR